jgi:hypothetical protein
VWVKRLECATFNAYQWYVCYVEGYPKSHREQVPRVISKKEYKRLNGINESMHCIIYDDGYVVNC